MKTKFLLIAFLLMTCSGYSQKCKYDFEKKDPFTGKSQKGISMVLAGFGPGAVRIAFQTEEKKYLVGISFNLPGRNENWIEKGDTLSLALENGEVLSLRSIDRYLPNVQVTASTIISIYLPMYAATEDEFKKLSSISLKATKIKLGSQPLLIERIPDKNKEKIKKSVGCILL